jgi:glycosyltransferase involved in cell wall biosynthesis
MLVHWLSQVIPYPPKAGILIRCYYLLKSVAERHDVDLVAFIQEPHLQNFYPTIDEGLEDCRKVLQDMCRSVTFLPIASLKRPLGKARTAFEGLVLRDCYSARWLRSTAAANHMSAAVRVNRYDVAHFDTIGLASYRSLFPDVPCTLGHHNIESHMMLRRAELERTLLRRAYFAQEGRRLAAYERRVAGRFARHFTCSDLDSQRLSDVAADAVAVAIPNGVDVDYMKPTGAGRDPASLVFVGTMSWYPNIDAIRFLLRDVWPLLQARRTDITLDIIGAGAPQSVVDMAASLPGVNFRGYVPDVRPWMDKASIYICPIRDGGGTKLKILDAMSMAQCIVAHPIACEGINVVDGTSVVYATEPMDFVERILELLPDASRRARIGAAARQIAVSEYSFSSIGAKLVAELEDVAASAHGTG